MIKIANIIEEGRLGGPQVRILEVAKRLYRFSINTIVILPKINSEKFQEKLKQNKVNFKTLSLHTLSNNLFMLIKYSFFFFYEIIIIHNYLKKEKFEIVHINGGSYQYKGAIAAKLAGIKVIVHINDTKTPVLTKYIFKFISAYYSDGFIVSAKLSKKYYLDKTNLINKLIFEIQAPVDCKKYDPLCVNRNRRLDKHKGITITTVANIVPIKGLEYFIEMAYFLNQKYDNLSFWIIGQYFSIKQKKYFEKLKKTIQALNIKNIHFYGYCNEIETVLRSSDIYICSSIAEASPMSVWEAMAMALPIVSTDVGDVSSYIKDNQNGYIVPIKSSKLLVEKCSLLIDKKNFKNFGIINRKIAFENFDIKIIVKKHIEAYNKFIKL